MPGSFTAVDMKTKTIYSSTIAMLFCSSTPLNFFVLSLISLIAIPFLFALIINAEEGFNGGLIALTMVFPIVPVIYQIFSAIRD